MNGDDLYKVMCAMVPLYVAMLLAYGSVKWWKILSPEQCSGINQFVAVFAVPVLLFKVISQNNPYQMDTKFMLADTISKILVLVLLSLWAIFIKGGSLDWVITLFSVATLPNTLIIGIPLLRAMYGDFTESLMVQLVFLQCVIWYTLLTFLLEYRAATLLIQSKFPGSTAASITKFDIDGDVISLDGCSPLCTESKIDGNGCNCVRIRRSTSSGPDTPLSSSSIRITPRASNFSGVEIHSINTLALEHESHHANWEIGSGHGEYGLVSPRLSEYAYSLQPTPRKFNFSELDSTTVTSTANTPNWVRSPVDGKVYRQHSPAFSGTKMVCGSAGGNCHCQGGGDRQDVSENDLNFTDNAKYLALTFPEKDLNFTDNAKYLAAREEAESKIIATDQEMPSKLVVLRLILTMVGRKLSRNPNTYSSVLGLLWSLISFKWNFGMPSMVKYSIKIISDTSLGMAMFSLGLFMALQPRIIACGKKRAAMGMVIRFICGPLLMAAASIAVGLRGDRLHTAIVQAALPQGIITFVFAREYGLHADMLSTAVIFGMLVSLPVTLLYYILLGL